MVAEVELQYLRRCQGAEIFMQDINNAVLRKQAVSGLVVVVQLDCPPGAGEVTTCQNSQAAHQSDATGKAVVK